MDLIITILPVVTKDLPISPRFTPYDFLSRCKFSTLTTRQPMVEFYLLTFPRFPLRKKEHKSYFGKNRTHDFRTSRCAGYLLDHSGDEGLTHVDNLTKVNQNKTERLSGMELNIERVFVHLSPSPKYLGNSGILASKPEKFIASIERHSVPLRSANLPFSSH